MSKPRYDWWPYIKGMIRRYPLLKAEHDELMRQSVTPSYSGLPGGSNVLRCAEEAAMVPMQKTSMREYYAVKEAIDHTEAMRDGADRLKLINLIYWKRTHSLVGATLECHISERAGREWHRQFIRLVAKGFGLLD